jgi:hypothetical protein
MAPKQQITTNYSTPQGLTVPNPKTIIAKRAPTTSDTGYFFGTIWVDKVAGNCYMLVAVSAGTATWAQLGGNTGAISAVNGTANQITATTVANVVTLSIPATFIAPGSIASTTSVTVGNGLTVTLGGATVSSGNIVATLGNITASAGNIAATAGSVSAGTTVTAGTSITATVGNITATNGNLVASTSGTGVTLPVVTASGAASGTVNCNGRVGSVTFTGVSIAAAADLTLTMGNTSVAGASTRLVWSMSGSTTGSAPSVKSYTPSANQVVWVVTNGTGATTTTANITFDFMVLN